MSAVEFPSGSELVKLILEAQEGVLAQAPGGVAVGPQTSAAQNLGCISIRDVGFWKMEAHVPIIYPRVSLVCTGPSIDVCETIFRACYKFVHGTGRRLVTDAQGTTWLVHESLINGGPSLSITPGEELWNTIAFLNLSVGTLNA